MRSNDGRKNLKFLSYDAASRFFAAPSRQRYEIVARSPILIFLNFGQFCALFIAITRSYTNSRILKANSS